MAASRTASLVCAYRGRASAARLCGVEDRFAARLAGDEGLALAQRFDLAFPHMELWIALRTLFLDEQIARAVARGVRQIVILGAGLDTRAARLATPGVTFYEVDHPETQADKLARLERLDDYPHGAARMVTCDFERDDFLERLASAGFLLGEPAFFVWEGVAYYLSEAAVRATLRAIAGRCHPASAVTFDYVEKRLVRGETRDLDSQESARFVSDLGEPLRFGIDDILPLLVEEGFRWVRATSFDEVCLAHTGTYERARKFRFQHLAIASRVRLDA